MDLFIDILLTISTKLPNMGHVGISKSDEKCRKEGNKKTTRTLCQLEIIVLGMRNHSGDKTHPPYSFLLTLLPGLSLCPVPVGHDDQ